MPSMRYSPSLGSSRQPRMLIVVDFPEPLAPVIATNSPARTSRFTPSSARTAASPSPYERATLRSERSTGELSVPGSVDEAICFSAFGRQLDQYLRRRGQSASGDLGIVRVADARMYA